MLNTMPKKVNHEEKRQFRYDLPNKIQIIAFMINRENSECSPSISDYAERHGISRETLYSLKKEFIEEFSPKEPGRNKGKKKKIAKRLSGLHENQQKKIKRVILTAAVMPASASEIKKLIIEAFNFKISKSTIKQIIRDYSNKAKVILEKSGLKEKVKYLAIDEIFSSNKPILTGVELNSFAVVICEKSKKRDSEAWKKVLGNFSVLELITSDQASGIIKAVSEMNIKHQYDIFHFMREACRVIRNLESQAYKKIESEYEAFEKLIKNKDDSINEDLSKNYDDSCNSAYKSIAVYDMCRKGIDMIFESLEVFDSNGKLFDPEKNLKKLEKGAGLLIKASTNKTIRNLAIRAMSSNLTLFLTQLHEKLLKICFHWNHGNIFNRKKVIEILAKHWFLSNQPKKKLSYKQDETYIQWRDRKEKSLKESENKHLSALFELRQSQIAVKNFNEVKEKVFQALSEVFRASSLVESYNSQVRICQQVKKGIHHNFLYLSALKWNCSPFQSGKRKGKSPFQILGIHSEHINWLDLILAD